MTRNLLALVHPDLRLNIRTTLFQVQQSGLPVTSRKVQLVRGQELFMVDITALPYRDDATESDLALVTFKETQVDSQPSGESSVNLVVNQMMSNLIRELQRTKLHLQGTVE
ncbi:hypothetical protein ABMA08_17775 [Pseudomonas yamanorum]